MAAWPAACGERGRDGNNARSPAAPAEVTLVAVQTRPVERTIDVTGTIYGEEETTIAAKVSGRIESIAADLGDEAAPAAELARVERRDYELALDERRAAVAAELARIGLSELPAEAFDASNVPSVARARAEAANAEARFRRAESLYNDTPPVISAEEFADARTAWEVAINEEAVELLTAKAVLAEARSLRTQEAAAEQRLADTVVRAPGRPGDAAPRYRVAQRLVSVGEHVSEGRAVFRLVASDTVKLRADVPERFAGQVSAGQVARVRVEAYGDAVEGRVSRISPSIDPESRAFRAEIEVDNREGRLKAGAFARGEIVTNVDDAALMVPRNAVVTFAGIHKVFGVRDGKAVEQRVRLGVEQGDWVEIVGGLPSDAVVAPGLPGLSNGAPVQVVER